MLLLALSSLLLLYSAGNPCVHPVDVLQRSAVEHCWVGSVSRCHSKNKGGGDHQRSAAELRNPSQPAGYCFSVVQGMLTEFGWALVMRDDPSCVMLFRI